MIAMKFGGTSMGSAERIAEVAEIVIKAKKDKPVVIVSAMTGVTNMLLEAAKIAMHKKSMLGVRKIIKALKEKHFETAKKLIKNEKILVETNNYIKSELEQLESFLEALAVITEMSHTSHDRIVAIGEKLSAKLLAEHLADLGENGVYVNLEKIVNSGAKKVDACFYKAVERNMKKVTEQHLKNSKIPVCTGFFGKIPNGIIEAIGRGYSDFCASIMGSAYNSDEIQIWTDVDGIFSADPRVVENAFVLEEVSFNEAAEMSSFGAKVIHPKTIWPAVKNRIPVVIKNTMNPKAKGTLITKDGKLSKKLCKAITSKKGNTVISVISSHLSDKYGFLFKIFEIFTRHQISVDVVATSEISVSVTIEKPLKSIVNVVKELKKLGKVNILENHSIICAIGSEMCTSIGSGSKILASIASQGLNACIITRNAMRNNISCVVDSTKEVNVVKTLHRDILEN